MSLYNDFNLICLLTSIALTSAVPLTGDKRADFLPNAARRDSVLVKRRVFEDDSDRQVKQVSLSSLVGDLEKNMLISALSFNKVLSHRNINIPDININEDSEQDVKIRQPLAKETTTTSTESINTSLPVTGIVILQNTSSHPVPQNNSLPAHKVIDRIAIQSDIGAISLIPIFGFRDKEKNPDVKTDHTITKTPIFRTETKSLATTPVPGPSRSFSSINSTSSSIAGTSSAITTPTTTEDILQADTTPKNIEKLKEAEEELREKFAEIEAEPIILSARV